MNGSIVDLHFVPIEEVREFEVANVGDANARSGEGVDRREDLDAESGGLSQVGDGADVDLCGPGEGEQQRVGLETPGRVGDVVAGSDDVDAVEVEAPLRRIVVEERDRVEVGLRILQERVADLFPGLAGAEDDVRCARGWPDRLEISTTRRAK